MKNFKYECKRCVITQLPCFLTIKEFNDSTTPPNTCIFGGKADWKIVKKKVRGKK